MTQNKAILTTIATIKRILSQYSHFLCILMSLPHINVNLL